MTAPARVRRRFFAFWPSMACRPHFSSAARTCCARPEISHWIRASGHEIGNHSHTHPNFALHPSIVYRGRIPPGAGSHRATPPERASAHACPLWRALVRVRGNAGEPGINGRHVECSRTRLETAARAPLRIESSRGAQDGAIVCLHDGRGMLKDPDISSTIEAVRRIVPALLEKGYRFETVSQLLWPTTN